jgi:hypothetical protein
LTEYFNLTRALFIMLNSLLSALGIQPKNLTEARGTLDTAKSTIEQATALFSAAGLDMDAMLQAGPDSLKAHIDSLGAKDSELAVALEKINALETAAASASSDITALQEEIENARGLFEVVGYESPENGEDPEACKAAFESYVKKAAALELAKVGHAPVSFVPEQKIGAKQLTAAEFGALPTHEKMNFATSGGRIAG